MVYAAFSTASGYPALNLAANGLTVALIPAGGVVTASWFVGPYTENGENETVGENAAALNAALGVAGTPLAAVITATFAALASGNVSAAYAAALANGAVIAPAGTFIG